MTASASASASPLRPLLPGGLQRPTRLPLLSVTLGLILIAVVTAGVSLVRPGEFQVATCGAVRAPLPVPRNIHSSLECIGNARQGACRPAGPFPPLAAGSSGRAAAAPGHVDNLLHNVAGDNAFCHVQARARVHCTRHDGSSCLAKLPRCR